MNQPRQVNNQNGIYNFRWNVNKAGQGIQITNGGKNVFLKESQYLFRTILGDTPVRGGIAYWEIWADSRTDNELKIGVTTKQDFNMNTSFSDFEFGFAFYGLGQLRHGSNASGS